MKKIMMSIAALLLSIAGAGASVVTYGVYANGDWTNQNAFQTFDPNNVSTNNRSNVDIKGSGTALENGYYQSFQVASNFTVGQIKLSTPLGDPSVGTFSVKIYQITNVNTTVGFEAQMTNLVKTISGLQVPVYTNTSSVFVQIGLDTTEQFDLAALSGNAGYLLQLSSDSTSSSPALKWMYATDSQYANGKYAKAGGNANLTRDFGLALEAIPEPATVGLFGVSALFVLIIRRYIRR